MLALTRERTESLNFYRRLPDGTREPLGRVIVLHSSEKRTRLGLEMPPEVEIVRGEIDTGEVAP